MIVPGKLCNPNIKTIELQDRKVKFNLENFTQIIAEEKEDFIFKHFELANEDIYQRTCENGLKFLFTKTESLKLVNQDFQSDVTLPDFCHLNNFEAVETMFPMPVYTAITSPMKLKSARIRLSTASINVRLFDLQNVERLDLQLSSYTSAVC